MSLTTYAYFVVGVFLLVVPWTPVWEQAAFGLVPEWLRGWVLQGWARGVISGLGAVNLLVAGQVGLAMLRDDRDDSSATGS